MKYDDNYELQDDDSEDDDEEEEEGNESPVVPLKTNNYSNTSNKATNKTDDYSRNSTGGSSNLSQLQLQQKRQRQIDANNQLSNVVVNMIDNNILSTEEAGKY